jgi:hypothetical protein
MAAQNNTVVSADVVSALDTEFVENFKGEADRLAELMGIIGTETIPAGTALYQYKVSGELNNAAGEGSSSGTAYIEGDLVALSKYKVEKTAIGSVDPVPYRKLTTAAAILKAGPEVAITRTDSKMQSHIRSQILGQFFTDLAAGTGTATGKNLQATLANVDAALFDAMESKGDEGGSVIHFMNRQDAAEYLGNASITTQTVAGLTYLDTFLGIPYVFLTNKVEKGTVYATCSENLHVYGIDFSGLAAGGLNYAADASGLIGVSHDESKEYAGTETNVMCGMRLFPEVTDYIIKGTIAPTA